MQAIQHPITHWYQSTNHNCCQTSLAMLMSHYRSNISPDKIINQVPVLTDKAGTEYGSINQQLATWCLSQGFAVTMYTFDFQIIDFEWRDLAKPELLARLTAVKAHRDIPSLGKYFSELYTQAYIDFVTAGGELHIQPHVTSKLLYELLESGPFMPMVCYNVLHNQGRKRDAGLRASEFDDLNGKIINHGVVVYGHDAAGNFQVADPWLKPGRHTVDPERLLCAITAAQIECDNLVFQISPV